MTRINRRASLRSSVKMTKNVGKENMGNVAGLSGKVKKSKARPMPNFSKIHQKWEKTFCMNKAQAKKPLTTVQEFGLSKKGMENDVVNAKQLGNRSPICSRDEQEDVNCALPRESFGMLAKQQQQGLDFVADSSALQSIINETGVSIHNLSPVDKSAQAKAVALDALIPSIRQCTQPVNRLTESGFKVPPLPVRFGATPCGMRVASLRDSLSHRGCEACHGKPTADNSPLAITRQRIGPKVIPQRNSVYVKLEYPQINSTKTPTKANEKRNDPHTPFSECKAARLLSKTQAHKSPGDRLTMTEGKAQRVPARTPTWSPLVSRLKHSAKTTGKKLLITWRDVLHSDDLSVKKKDKLAVQLQFADEPTAKKTTPPNKHDTDFKLQNLEVLETKLEEDIMISKVQETKATEAPRESRPVLGELPADEVERRSNPAFRQEKQASKAKLKAMQAKTLTNTPTKKVHFQSPRARTNMSPSSRYNIHRNSPRSKLTNKRTQSPKASRSCVVKSKESRFSPMSKKFALADECVENEVYSLMCDLDKENSSPAASPLVKKTYNPDVQVLSKNHVKQSSVRYSTVKLLNENEREYVLLEESYGEMSVEQVNATLNESVLAMEQLHSEAQSLVEHSLIDDSTQDIAAQLKLIQQKQEELMDMQMALHQRLAEKKAKKRQQKRQQKEAVEKSGKHGDYNGAKVLNDKCGNVVDVSPICGGSGSDVRTQSLVDMSPIAGTTFTKLDHTMPYHTPDKGASPTLLYNANKRSPLFPPLESTASESVYQRHENEPAETVSPKNDANGVWLAAGLLQMAQEMNAMPHKNKHWKKQMLDPEDPICPEFKKAAVRKVQLTSAVESPMVCESHTGVDGESFTMPSYYDAALQSKYPTFAYNQGSAVNPIGTPSTPLSMRTRMANVQTTPSNQTPVMSITPLTVVRNPMCASPQRLFSGSAQILPGFTPTGPIQTPLAMRDRASRQLKSNNSSPNSDFSVSLDESKSADELSMAFTEGPSSAFKSPRGFRRLSFKSPGSVDTSPVQFTLNRKTTPSIVRPRPVLSRAHNSQCGGSSNTSAVTVTSPSSQHSRARTSLQTVSTTSENVLNFSGPSQGKLFGSQATPAVTPGRKSISPSGKLKGYSPSTEVGELSLRGNVKGFSPQRRGGWSILESQLLETTRGRYLDALADQEVQSITTTMPMLRNLLFIENERCGNPVSHVLLHGDEFHFVPIPQSECRAQSTALTPRRKMLGSAFSQLRV